MISGAVSSLRWPEITVVLIDADGHDRVTEANIDTGFSGDLTLPNISIERLGLRPVGRSVRYRTGSGATTSFSTYAGMIRWNDSVRRIDVLESEIFPVIGVGLL